MLRMKKLTPLSYGLLGYLALQPCSAYELTKIWRESGVRMAWPRTESRLYTEPGNLVEHGLATARVGEARGRSRTVYRITAKGRRALRDWLDEPGDGPSTSHEALLKVFLANFGTKDQLLRQLAVMRETIGDAYRGVLGYLEAVESNGTLWPERAHLSQLLTEEYLATLEARAEWLVRIERRVRDWSDTEAGDDPVGEAQRWARRTGRECRNALKRFEQAKPSSW